MKTNTNQHFHFKNERELKFQRFKETELSVFWEAVNTSSAINSRNQSIAMMSYTHPSNDKAVLLITGRAESYLRYQELIYDLYHEGFDVYSFDHIGQGFSDRILVDMQKGHVECFSDYVDDLIFCAEHFFNNKKYSWRFALAHSMGGGILAHAILKLPNLFTAAAFCAPMFGINIPLPEGIAKNILDIAERYPSLRDYYALGSGKWRPLPFALNRLTHSAVRYEYKNDLIENTPELKMGGPTFHWVRESKLAAEEILNSAKQWSLPSLVLQAEKEVLVCNESQKAFIEKCTLKPEFFLIKNARHELLMEKDEIRIEVLNHIFSFFCSQIQIKK